jgi:hypothetical protein
MFTLTDPRKQAISQAGQNFGGGLGDALINFIENKRFQQAMSGVTAETPVQEVLTRFAQNNVSPQWMERYLSPQVQNRMLQQRYEPKLVDRMKLYQDEATVGTEARPEMRDSGSVSKGGPVKPISDTTPNQFDQTQVQQQTQQPVAQNQIIPQSVAQNIQQPVGQFQQQPIQESGQQPITGDFRSDVRSNAPVTPLATDRDRNSLIRQGLQAGLSPEAAENYADKKIELQNQRRADEIATLARDELARKTVIEVDENLRNEAEKYLSRDYGTERDPIIDDMVTRLMREGTGTAEQRYTKARPVVTRILNSLNNINEGQRPPLVGGREKFNAYIRKQQSYVKALLKDPQIPASFKKDIMEKVITNEMAKGTGRVDAEMIANPPSANFTKLLNSVEEKPKPKILNKYGVPDKKSLEDYQLNVNSSVERLSNKIAQMVDQSPWSSPLVMRSSFLDKGYTEADIAEAFLKAQEAEVPFSDYQNEQIGKLAVKERPSLDNIFRGEKSQIEFLPYLRGNR